MISRTGVARWGAGIVVFSLLGIAAITLVPTPGEAARAAETPWWCLLCGELGTLDFLYNVVMFAPLGVGLALVGWRWPAALAFGLALSLGIEGSQLLVIAGRDPSLGDVIANTLGAASGVVLVGTAPRLRHPTPRGSEALALLAALLWFVTVAVGAAFLKPSFPPAIYWGQWNPHLGGFDSYDGRVLAAEVSGHPMESFAFSPSEALRRDMVAGPVTVLVRTVAGRTPGGLAPIFRVADERGRQILLVAQARSEFVAQIRMAGSRWKVRTPSFAVPSGPTVQVGDTLVIAVVLNHSRLHFTVTSRVGTTGRLVALSPSLLWAFVLPFPVILDQGTRRWTAAWIALLLLPAGYWGFRHPRVRRKWTMVGALGFVVAAGLAGVPRIAGVPPVHWSEWVAAAVGLGGGMLLSGARWSRRESVPVTPLR